MQEVMDIYRSRDPYDNAMAENFFSILKTEYIHRTKIKLLPKLVISLMIAFTSTIISVFS